MSRRRVESALEEYRAAMRQGADFGSARHDPGSLCDDIVKSPPHYPFPFSSRLLVAFLVLELGIRVADGEYRLIRFLGEERTLFTSAYPSRHDPMLGWVPRAGQTSRENVWGKTVTILPRSIRSNGPGDAPSASAPPILAVGDSFTFGDQVSDAETWPARLEEKLDRRVINGGVFGYGLDQSFLRAMHLAEIFRPDTLIVGLIPEDIDRCGLSARQGAQKPYFKVDRSRLIIKNVPVPEPVHEEHRGTLRNAFSRSYLVHRLMMHCFPHWWRMGVTWDNFYTTYRVHRKENPVACLILGELNDMARRADIDRVLVVIQYLKKTSPENRKRIRLLKENCVKGRRVRVLDLWAPLTAVQRQDRKRYDAFFDRHMTAEGNDFVAEQIRRALAQPWEPP